LDNPGLERYHDIFIEENCAVHSPARFKRFLNVMRYGEKSHIEILRTEPDQLLVIEQDVKDDKADSRFRSELERIEKKLKGLKIGDYQQSEEEDRLINSIGKLVNLKLGRLTNVKEQLGGVEGGHKSRGGSKAAPSTIQEALLLSYEYLSEEILLVLDDRKSKTCLVENIPKYLLKRWRVVSRSEPLRTFRQLVAGILNKMKDEDRLTID